MAVNPFKLVNGLYGEVATERFAKQACLLESLCTLQPLAHPPIINHYYTRALYTHA